jgi:hypothetical protein
LGIWPNPQSPFPWFSKLIKLYCKTKYRISYPILIHLTNINFIKNII